MSSDIIKEFLVALGYKIDEKEYKKFNKSIDDATKAATKLGASMVAAAAAVEYAAAKIADHMSTLYFSSKRINDSVQNIEAFKYAIEGLGGTVDGAQSSLENLGAFLRNIPAAEGFLKGLGVTTRDANGQLIKTGAIMEQLAAHFTELRNHGQQFVAKAQANVLGIDERTLLAMEDGSFIKRTREYEGIIRNLGVDQDAAAVAQTKYNQELIRFHAYLDGAVILFETKLLPALADFLQYLDGLIEALTKIGRWFEHADEASGGFLSALAEISSAVLKIIAVMLLLLNALRLVRIALALLGAVGLLNPIVIAITLIGAAALVVIRHWDSVKRWFSDFFGWMERKWKWLVDSYNSFAKHVGLPTIGDSTAGQPIKINQAAITSTGTTGGAGPQAQKAMRYFEQAGWSTAQAAGLVANLMRESALNPNASGDNGRAYGLGQWHADRQAEFAKFAGHDIRQSTFAEQLAFVNYELTKGAEQMAGARLRQAQNPRDSGSIVSQLYERPANAFGEALLRGSVAQQLASNGSGGTATISQKTNITVVASNDPQETADEVARRQGGVNASLVRNTEGALR